MKTYCKDIVRLPDYACAPMITGNLFGMNKEDKKNIFNFMKPYYDMADKLNHGNVIICQVDEQTDSYWSASPAFGLPCCVYDSCIQVLYEPLVKHDQALVETYSRPDVKVVLDEFDVITGCDTLTRIGERFVAVHKMIGAVYTTILNNSHGICFEVVR